MELEEGQVKLRNNKMYVITRVSNKRPPLAISGQIIQRANIIDPDQKFIKILHIVKVRIAGRPGSVEAFEIKARSTKVTQFFEARMVQEQAAVSRDIMSNELSEDRKTSGNTRMVSAFLWALMCSVNIHHRPLPS